MRYRPSAYLSAFRDALLAFGLFERTERKSWHNPGGIAVAVTERRVPHAEDTRAAALRSLDD
jgi:hypothetical protein